LLGWWVHSSRRWIVTLSRELWSAIRCVVCRRPADHALELLLPLPKGKLMPALVGFCMKHYELAKRTPRWKELPIVEAATLEPRGRG